MRSLFPPETGICFSIFTTVVKAYVNGTAEIRIGSRWCRGVITKVSVVRGTVHIQVRAETELDGHIFKKIKAKNVKRERKLVITPKGFTASLIEMSETRQDLAIRNHDPRRNITFYLK